MYYKKCGVKVEILFLLCTNCGCKIPESERNNGEEECVKSKKRKGAVRNGLYKRFS